MVVVVQSTTRMFVGICLVVVAHCKIIPFSPSLALGKGGEEAGQQEKGDGGWRRADVFGWCTVCE